MKKRELLAQGVIAAVIAAFSVLHGCDCTVRMFIESDATWRSGDGAADERLTTDDGTADAAAITDGAADGGTATEDGGSGADGGSADIESPCFVDFPCPFTLAGGPSSGTLCKGNNLYQCETYTVPECEGATSAEVLLTTCPGTCEDFNDGKAKCGEVTGCPSGNEGDTVFSFQAAAKISGTPAIGPDGTIYFGSTNATFYAVGCDGKKKWEWKCPCEAQAFEGSPAIGSDGTIYIGDDVAVPNYLFALYPDGTEKWRYTAQGVNSEMDSSPALGSDGTVYIGSGNYVMDGPTGALHAFSPDGTAVAGFPITLDGAAVASAAIKGDTLYAVSTSLDISDTTYSSKVMAVSRDGKVRWTTQLAGAASSVSVGGSGSVYVTESIDPGADPMLPRTNLLALDPSDGRISRTIEIPANSHAAGEPAPSAPIIASAAFGEDVIVMLEDGHLVSANPQSGGAATNFDLKLGDFGHGSAVLGDDGFIYAAAEKDDFTYATLVFKISRDGTAINQIAQFTGERVTTSLSMGANGVLYFGTESGKLFSVQTGAAGLERNAPWPTFRHDDRNTGNADYVPGHPCAPKDRLWAGISPYSPAGETTFSETVQVSYKGISLPGGTCNLMYFDAWESGQEVKLCYNLPFGYEIPVSEGEIVKLSMAYDQGAECCFAQRMYIWDAAQNLRFYFYSGDPAYFEPYECADPKACPAVWFADSACIPADEDCGKTVHPPIRFSMGAPGCDRVVQQGEVLPYVESDAATCVGAAAAKLIAVESMKMLTQECVDYPNATISALFLNNTRVSQCMCQDHLDCAPGWACETEARRCVKAETPEVPCEAGRLSDPYTGGCFNPYDQSLTPCTNTADCAAQGKGVCNTWWKTGPKSGFCQTNPCEVMDCAWACSPLLGTCFECLSDCDCYVPEMAGGICDTDTHFCMP